MDCFASNLGQTTLRCDGLTAVQARLLMFPATLFFIGALIVFANWTRLTLSGSSFHLRQLLCLFIYGLYVFSLAVADHRHPVSKQDYLNSRIIGGISSGSTALFVLCLFNFLPPRVVLPELPDRLNIAFSCASIITGFLGSISHFTPDGVPSETQNNFYASSAFMLACLLSILFCSQYARFFSVSVRNRDRQERKACVSLGTRSNYLFIAALLLSMNQACLTLKRPTEFVFIFVESMQASIAYLLLVAMSILLSLPTKIPDKPNEKPRDRNPNSRETRNAESQNNESPRRAARTRDGTPNQRPFVLQPNRRGSVIDLSLDANHDEGQQDNATRIQSELSIPESGEIIWNGGAMFDQLGVGARPESLTSALSIKRLTALMKSQREQERDNNLLRPTSGVTAYGSEASFLDCDTSRRRSYISAMMGNGFSPPVPPLNSNFVKNFAGTSTSLLSAAQYAKPLTHGESPIPLYPMESDMNVPTAKVAPKNALGSVPSAKGFYWRTEEGKKEGPGPYVKHSTSTSQLSSNDQTMHNSSSQEASTSNHSRMVTNKPSISSLDSIQSTSMNRYRSPKLFPNMIGEQDAKSIETIRPTNLFQTEHPNKTFDQQILNSNGMSKDSTMESREISVSQESKDLADAPNIDIPEQQTPNTFDSDQSYRNTVLSQVSPIKIEKKERQPINRTKRSIPNLSTIVEPQPTLPLPRRFGTTPSPDVYGQNNGLNGSISNSPRDQVFKETRHPHQDISEDFIEIPLSAVSPPPSSPPGKKVNRGKVLRKQDVEEDNRARISGSIRFPATAY